MMYSRIRLARNWKQYSFPDKLEEAESREMITRLENGLRGLSQLNGHQYEFAYLDQLQEVDKLALRERRILNSAMVTRKEPTGIVLSEDESVSLILNGADHIRLQCLKPGLNLKAAWREADMIDDYINERFEYAFHDKYGYLTSFPTNVGTGMRAVAVVHLPCLSLGSKFRNMLGDMSRFGVNIKGFFGDVQENYGCLYEISNQKTLGQTEGEIVDVVGRVAGQLAMQELKIREAAMREHSLQYMDEVYKSYGVLKYAKRLAFKDAMTFLSSLLLGTGCGLITFEQDPQIFATMLGSLTANLQKLAKRPLSREELEVARADYIRNELPEIKK